MAPACERNKEPILNILKLLIPMEPSSLLEVGSGTGQHASFLAPYFPKLTWTTSDIKTNHSSIRSWTDEITNITGPLEYEIGTSSFPANNYNVVFTANTLHIISWNEVKIFIADLGKYLSRDALVIIYGPFNYDGSYTSDSNQEFDKWLKKRNPRSGIRNFEDVEQNFISQGFELLTDYEMPANNRILVFKKIK